MNSRRFHLQRQVDSTGTSPPAGEGVAMNRRAFLLGAGSAIGAQAAEPWVRRAYSFLWSRPEEQVIYVDTDSLFTRSGTVVTCGASGQWSVIRYSELDRVLTQQILASKARLIREAGFL